MNVRVLIMDEPTASLSAHEVQELFRLARDLKNQGVAILFVSHRMEEVFEIADDVSVFRDGRRSRRGAAPKRPRTGDRGHGRSRDRPVQRERARRAASACCRSANCAGMACSRTLSFDLHRGEVLGMAGLIGAGRTEVGLALFGIEPATPGQSSSATSRYDPLAPRGDEARLAYVSEDRRQLGLVLPKSIFANITLPALRRYLDRSGCCEPARNARPRGRFVNGSPFARPQSDLPVAKLSGGNQQKVMLSKWLNTRTRRC